MQKIINAFDFREANGYYKKMSWARSNAQSVNYLLNNELHKIIWI